MSKQIEDKKNWSINWSSVVTTVVTGAILGALGVLGTMVYQGAILKTNINEATAETILESVSKNVVSIDNLTKLIDRYHNSPVLEVKDNIPTFILQIDPSEFNLDTTQIAVSANTVKPKSVFKRVVETVTLKPLWEKQDTQVQTNYIADTIPVTNTTEDVQQEAMLVESVEVLIQELEEDTQPEVNVSSQQQEVIDQLQQTIAIKTKAKK